jgi:hypothetical protein
MATRDGADLSRLFRDRRLNAVLAWVFVALMLVVDVVELAVGDPVSALFGAGVVVVVLIPPIRFRSWEVMLPWEVVALASLPTVGRAVSTWAPAGSVATYLAVAAVALMIAVELHAFTSVEMSYGFAVLFVVVTTLAAAGTWAVARWLVDVQFGTALIESEEALMWEFVASTVAGIGAGAVFRVYFGRGAYSERIPERNLADGEPATEASPGDPR